MNLTHTKTLPSAAMEWLKRESHEHEHEHEQQTPEQPTAEPQAHEAQTPEPLPADPHVPEPQTLPLLTPEQLAQKLNVSRRCLSNWTRDKIIPMTKVGRICRFDYAKVRAALQKYERPVAQHGLACAASSTSAVSSESTINTTC